jgi:glutamine synthetase
MRVHQSIWKGGRNEFAGDGFAGLSQVALWYVGGLLRHAPALCALCNPSTNSYKRLVPGSEAPVSLDYSGESRSVAVRLPAPTADRKARRVEFRTPDPSCNGYLAFAAMLMAGLDGIENRIDPGDPLERSQAGRGPEDSPGGGRTPESLGAALSRLEADHGFLLKGDVFTEDALELWISWKRKHEVEAVERRPVPWEFALYFDC